MIEPPSTRVAAGIPAVDAFGAAGQELYAEAATGDPDVFLRRFLAAVGSEFDPPSPLPRDLERGARNLGIERGPWEAEVPVRALRAGGFPILAITGGQRPMYEEIADALAAKLGAERSIVPGSHAVQNVGAPFNDVVEAFWRRAELRARAPRAAAATAELAR